MAVNDWGIPISSVEIYQEVFVPAIIAEWLPRVLALCAPQPGERVLDVACGTGALTRAAAEAVEPGGSVVGADISPEMLGVARKCLDWRYPDIAWRECDALHLPFEDVQFDVVFCQLGLMFMPDKVAALSEMRRVLKPNGRLGVMVWGAIEKCPGHMALARTWEKLFGPDMAARIYRMHSMSDPEKLLVYLNSAGFKDVDVQVCIGTMKFPSAEYQVRNLGAMGGFEADEAQQAAAICEVTQELEAYMGEDMLAYPVEAVLGKAKG